MDSIDDLVTQLPHSICIQNSRSCSRNCSESIDSVARHSHSKIAHTPRSSSAYSSKQTTLRSPNAHNVFICALLRFNRIKHAYLRGASMRAYPENDFATLCDRARVRVRRLPGCGSVTIARDFSRFVVSVEVVRIRYVVYLLSCLCVCVRVCVVEALLWPHREHRAATASVRHSDRTHV